jgi:hypothetical protein
MVNYQKGKVYAIRSHKGDKVYVGSTTNEYLSTRMALHRNQFKKWSLGQESSSCSSRELFNDYGVENCYIELLETVPCNSREELNTRENHFIRTLNCVNKKRAFTSPEQKAEYHAEYSSEYYKKHKEELRLYRQNHKEEMRLYRQNHKEEMRLYQLNYRQTHKQESRIYQRIYQLNYRAWKIISKEFMAILLEG